MCIKFGETSWAVDTGKLPGIFKENNTMRLGTALDMGCGKGTACIFLQSHFSKVYAVDLDSYLIPEAKKIADFSKIDLNFERLPYKNKSLDLVTAFQVIEHLENPFFVMREVHRVLRKGGLFVMSVPNPFQITHRIKFLFSGNLTPYRTDNNHLLFLTRDTFQKTYLENFDLVETIYQKGAVPFWGRFRPALHFLTRKSMPKRLKILPQCEWFAKCVCYVLKKK